MAVGSEEVHITQRRAKTLVISEEGVPERKESSKKEERGLAIKTRGRGTIQRRLFGVRVTPCKESEKIQPKGVFGKQSRERKRGGNFIGERNSFIISLKDRMCRRRGRLLSQIRAGRTKADRWKI